MKKSCALALVLGMVACGVDVAAAQSFSLGGLGFGLLGGGPALGIGSPSTETGSTTPSGTSFGTQLAPIAEFTGELDKASESLAGSGIVRVPQLIPSEIPVHTDRR